MAMIGFSHEMFTLKHSRNAIVAAVFVTMSIPKAPAKPPDRTTEIRIQIMDSRTHAPLKGRKVEITFPDTARPNKATAGKTGRTNSDGIVSFDVDSADSSIDVFVRFVFTCSRTEEYSTRTVLDDGVVSRWSPSGFKKTDKWCSTDLQAPGLQKQPGKLILLVHPMNRFVWSWYDTFQ
jgi:hypothetical protein